MEKKQYDMRIKTITKTDKEREDGIVTTYKLTARDKEGLNEITIVSAEPFKGVNAKSGVVQLTMENSQLTIEDFKER